MCQGTVFQALIHESAFYALINLIFPYYELDTIIFQ